MVYWIPHWNSDEMKDWQKGLHNAVIFFSVVNFLLKIPVIIMLGLRHKDSIIQMGKIGGGRGGQQMAN
jgi:hypothetical protein